MLNGLFDNPVGNVILWDKEEREKEKKYLQNLIFLSRKFIVLVASLVRDDSVAARGGFHMVRDLMQILFTDNTDTETRRCNMMSQQLPEKNMEPKKREINLQTVLLFVGAQIL